MSYAELLAGLAAACASGAVHRRYDPASGLSLYVYTNACVYDDLWDAFSTIARGLILDEENRRVVATPFPKFFNAGEPRGTIPDLPFEVFEKVDGSLIIVFHHAGAWRCTTKGAFHSDQAEWARIVLDGSDTSRLVPGTTYLAEAVYRDNRIVVRYDETGLILLAAYDEDGRELTFAELGAVGAATGWRLARRHAFVGVADMIAHAEVLPRDEEGFVARFTDGTRLKIKGAEYRRVHALISRCTPLAMWEAIVANDDLEGIRRDLPEEFWPDFDAIVGLLRAREAEVKARIAALAEKTATMSDKEVGLSLKGMDGVAAPHLFAFRKGFSGKVNDAVLKAIRPTGNALAGYVPSYALHRALDDT